MLRIENLSKSFGSRILLNNVSYHFPQNEKIALIGLNGTGKTTLLNMLAGFESYESGTIIRPSSCKLGYLVQEPNPHPAPSLLQEAQSGATRLMKLKESMDSALHSMEHTTSEKQIHVFDTAETAYRSAGGYALDSRVKETLAGLGFSQDQFSEDPLTLSGGWRMRLELAKLFLSEPDFLILDEPTNYLDLPSLVWMENYLKTFSGTVLFVSHDRSLLNKLPTVILHLHKGILTPYAGNLDFFLEARETLIEQKEASKKQLEKRRASIERFITRFGAKNTKASQAKSRMKMLARLRDLESEIDQSLDDSSEDYIQLAIPEPSQKTGKVVLSVEHGAIGYQHPAQNASSLILSNNINLLIEREQKIAIIGANGIGKSTLLKTIAHEISPISGEFSFGLNISMAYFAQDQLASLDLNKTALDNLLSETPLGEKDARRLLGNFLFHGDDVFKQAKVLSGGEKSRLGLAKILAVKANFLLLDEPTSHLDMTSIEALTNALSEYTGTVLFVSHDRSFIDQICTHIFAMYPDGRSQLFEGNLSDYERMAPLSGLPNILDYSTIDPIAITSKLHESVKNDKFKTIENHEYARDLKRDRQRFEKQLTSLDEKITTHRTELKMVETSIAHNDATAYQKAHELCSQQKQLQDVLSNLEDEWLMTSERLEEIKSKLQKIGRS